MNEEETLKLIEMTINKSNKEYISLKEQFEELRNDYIELARSEEQLQNNWNELKKWCKENQYIGKTITFENDVTYTEVLKKMEELQGDDKN